MIKFILNDQTIETDLPAGMTVLDFVRYRKNLKGTKIGCREGDCGACTVLVGELSGEAVKYRSMTSCLMPLANARSKHVVTIEGINPPQQQSSEAAGDELTPVQKAIIDESGTQCGFCTVGFVMSLTGFCIDDGAKTREAAVSAIDGNICRCTGYKSIERAAVALANTLGEKNGQSQIDFAVTKGVVPNYFSDIKHRLSELVPNNPKSKIQNPRSFVGGGTDLYVQRPEEMTHAGAENLFDAEALKLIKETEEFIEIGASAVVTDLLESQIFQRIFPNLYKHLKLVSSTPIRNMATLAGNFVNASPIGDMTAWFLALDAEIELATPPASSNGLFVKNIRGMALRDFYLGYKQLAKTEEEFITRIRIRKDFTHFNFEKVSKRTYLDIASVNTALSLKVEIGRIQAAHVSMGGVAPVPLYLAKTSAFLRGREVDEATISEAGEILQTEITPISDVRGSADYKRLLARQLFTAHFVELFDLTPNLKS